MDAFNPFRFDGRIGRLQFLGYGFAWLLIVVIVAAAAGAGSGPHGVPFFGVYSIDFLLTIVLAIATVSYGVRRLHDLAWSGWWYLLAFLPVVGFVLAVILVFAPGTRGPNRYGVR